MNKYINYHKDNMDNDSKLNDSKLNDSKLNDFKLNDFKLNDFKLNDFKLNDFKLNYFKINDFKLNDSKLNDSKLNDFKLNGDRSMTGGTQKKNEWEKEFKIDCPNYEYVPSVLPPVKRIIAIGDIHGDLNLAIRSFKLAKLIDDNYNWIANPKNTIVVQVGDQIDSCRPIAGSYDCHSTKKADDKAEDISVLIFFNKMHQKALIHGGAVYSLLGNHELMNAQGKFYYVSHENFYNYKFVDSDGNTYIGPDGRISTFKPGGAISNMLACTRLSSLIIGSTLFVHAGILPIIAGEFSHLNRDDKLQYLNKIVRKWLLNTLSTSDTKTKNLIIDNIDTSPFWTRIFGSIPNDSGINDNYCYKSVKPSIEILQIGQLVVGHTPQILSNKKGINGTCYKSDGSHALYRIDGGFSHAFKFLVKANPIQILEIIDDTKFNIITENNVTESTSVSVNTKSKGKINYRMFY